MNLGREVINRFVKVLHAVLAVDGTLLSSNGRKDKGSEEQQSTEGDHDGRRGGRGERYRNKRKKTRKKKKLPEPR